MSRFQDFIPNGATNVRESGNIVTFEVSAAAISQVVSSLLAEKNLNLKLIDATDERQDKKCFKVWYVFGVPGLDLFVVPYICLKNTRRFPSVSSISPGAKAYERKIRSFFGLKSIGNRDKRPMILHENWPEKTYPLRKDFSYTTRPKPALGPAYTFQSVGGEGVYEIPVGPIHAGIIEPGHFRFSVAGESIMLLEARLGYVHKGSEKLFERLDLDGKLRLSQKISGDSSLSHSLAFCQAIESLAGLKVPARAQYLRVIFAELERLANHLGDIGFIMLDTGYNFGGAYGARLRETVMQLNQNLVGSRFLRGINAIGGVAADISATQAADLATALGSLLIDFGHLIDIAEECDTLLHRLKTTAPLDPAMARDYGVVGVAARASGLPRDARVEHTYAAYDKLESFKISLEEAGDVYARYRVRVQEVRGSIGIILEALKGLPSGKINTTASPLALQKDAVAIGCVEGWRGEIVYLIVTDREGEIGRVAVRDPSFINWQVVGSCGQGQIVPDFPLINKSFNLSYTGNDL